MAQFIHNLHQYILLIVRYLVIFTVIGFMPIPLFTFFGGEILQETDSNPLFQYFTHFGISTDSILENTYTNVYIDQKSKNIEQHDIDNAILWADYLAYQLTEEDIPVARMVISTGKVGKVESLQTLHSQAADSSFLNNPQLQDTLLTLKQKFELLLPIKSVTQDARQWIILALNSDEKNVKKQLKALSKDYPNDNFLVISQTPISLGKKSFNIELPEFNVKQAKRIISQGLKVSEPQAEVLLIQHQKSLWSLNQANGQNIELTIKSLLGEDYSQLKDLSKKQEQVLEELCENSKAKVNKKLSLEDYGVTIKNKQYVWQNEASQLNYELQKGVLCGKNRGKWIDTQKVEESNLQSGEDSFQKNEQKAQQTQANEQTAQSIQQQQSQQREQKQSKKSSKSAKQSGQKSKKGKKGDKSSSKQQQQKNQNSQSQQNTNKQSSDNNDQKQNNNKDNNNDNSNSKKEQRQQQRSSQNQHHELMAVVEETSQVAKN